ncbi:MAG TPA: RraA family protein [Paenibacillus sp.]|nr:RraA family protein [Paenibacillus sp.]
MTIAMDKERFDLMKRMLYTGVICDTMDEMGYRNQAMRENIRPLSGDVNDIAVGRAKTILAADVYYIHENPYDMEINALDSVLPDEIVVASTNCSVRNGLWGELLSTAAKMRGSNGAIIDGLVRDTKRIKEMGFPVYCTGIKPVDSRGRGIVIDYDCTIEAGGVTVSPNDVIFADCDGVAVIPKAIFAEVVERAIEKVKAENHTRDELLQGRTLREVFDKYGVL